MFSSTLPPCKGTFGLKTRWTDCHGAVIYPNGDKYVGEWKYDKRHGNGTIFWKTPINDRYNLYVGEWQNDIRAGYGTLTTPSGSGFSGRFKNNVADGRGFMFEKENEKVVGEVKNGEWIAD